MPETPSLCAALTARGIPSALIPVKRLADVRRILETLGETETLNGFQQWLLRERFNLTPPSDLPFTAQSVLLVACRQPFASRVVFTWQGAERAFTCMPHIDVGELHAAVGKTFAEAGVRFQETDALPLKRMAAQSGLTMYGRCNVTFREDWGSSFMLDAYWTDAPCPDECDPWLDAPRVSPRCTGCRVCENACPTHALEPGRFLLHTDKCISFYNESAGEVPAWIPASAHRTLYDCLHCLSACPMNAEARKRVTGPVVFSEAETETLLAGGTPWGELPDDLRARLCAAGEDDFYYNVLPRNLRLMLASDAPDDAAPAVPAATSAPAVTAAATAVPAASTSEGVPS